MPRCVLWMSGTLFLLQRLGDRTQVVSLGGNCHHSLSHVTNPTASTSAPGFLFSAFLCLAILLIYFSFID